MSEKKEQIYPLVTYEVIQRPADWKAHDVNFIRNGEIAGTGFIDKQHPKFVGLINCPCCGLRPRQLDARLGFCSMCGWQTTRAMIH